MKLLTSFAAVAATLAFGSYAAHAQDSPIYLSDNGNLPDMLGARGKASGPADARSKAQGGDSVKWNDHETHVAYPSTTDKIQQGPNRSYYFVDDGKSVAVCFETPGGDKFRLDDDGPWSLITISRKDNLAFSSSAGDTRVRIDPAANTAWRDANHLDDVDPTGGMNAKLMGVLLGWGTSFQWYPNDNDKKPFVIHYCGKNGCTLDGVDRCKNAQSLHALKKK